MNIHLRYFASFREATGKNEEALALHDAATIADVRTLLIERYPRLHALMERAACAVNHRYVSPETVLHEGDEVAFIPPVGGGTCQGDRKGAPLRYTEGSASQARIL